AITGQTPTRIPPHFDLGAGMDLPAREDADEGDTPGEREAATPASGLPAAADLDMDAGVLARLDTVIQEALADGAAPGAALAVGRTRGLVRLRGYGRLDHGDGAAPVEASTLYDLASLTK